MTCMPDDFRRGMESGGGASMKLTWPDSSAATRVAASGIGSAISRSCFGTRAVSQYSLFGTYSIRSCGTMRSKRYGPVPEGRIA